MMPRNPTLREKKLIHKWGLNSGNWRVVKSNDSLTIIHKVSDKIRVIPEGVK